jgi:cytochrome c biogenesis DsbD-like protein
MKRRVTLQYSVMMFAAIFSIAAKAQIISPNAPNRPAIAKTDAVRYLFPEQVAIPADKPNQVVLHFRVGQGLHINSHTPSEEYLIPTDFSIPDGAGVRLEGTTYPAGTIISLPFDPKTKLSVYTGDFIIQARVVASPGNHLVQAKLHFQACDQNQCLPPKTINVPIDVIGK